MFQLRWGTITIRPCWHFDRPLKREVCHVAIDLRQFRRGGLHWYACRFGSLPNRGNWERVRPATGISVTAGGPLGYARSRAIVEVKVINGSVPVLSPREKRILRRLARGYSDRAIAVQIGGRPEQVGEQRKRLLQKLQISSQSEIAEAAAQWASWPSYKFTTAVDELHAWPKHRENGGCEPPS